MNIMRALLLSSQSRAASWEREKFNPLLWANAYRFQVEEK